MGLDLELIMNEDDKKLHKGRPKKPKITALKGNHPVKEEALKPLVEA